jgi:hypothetical protein
VRPRTSMQAREPCLSCSFAVLNSMLVSPQSLGPTMTTAPTITFASLSGPESRTAWVRV